MAPEVVASAIVMAPETATALQTGDTTKTTKDGPVLGRFIKL
jgi:hypothetical protein